MEGIFKEFENENALRSYPFAAGCEIGVDQDVIPPGVFVDAAIYPVNPVGTVYLSSVSADGVFSVSDDTGVIMSGSASGSTVELYDNSGLSRHVGTLVASSAEALSDFSGRGNERKYGRDVSSFSASCVLPIVIDGVSSIDVGGSGVAVGDVEFSNGPEDEVRVSSGVLEDGRRTLRFDVLPESGRRLESIRRIICVVDGQTPFRIRRHETSYNTIVLTMTSSEDEDAEFCIDKEAVCASAHRENDFEMVDACSCEKVTTERSEIPETYQLEEVFIPTTESRPEGADCAFYLVVPNLLNYGNPISITLEDGIVSPKVSEPELVVDGYNAEIAEGEMLDDMTSNGIVIQVPGLSGGMV